MPDEEKIQEILDFIGHFEDCENTFEEDGGYWFALILTTRFPDGEIAVAPERPEFVAWIDDHAYDITGDVTDKYDHGELKNWERLCKSSARYVKHLTDKCVLFKEIPDTGPNLDNLETKYGFVTDKESKAVYVLTGLPAPETSTPMQIKYGPKCVSTYAIQVQPDKNVPTGSLCLTIWENMNDFNNGKNPSCITKISE